jgi:exodeoxyribonuclease-3
VIEQQRPDVLCLQETRSQTRPPTAVLQQRGYHVAARPARTYNGVAILSRAPLADVTRGFGDGDEDAAALPRRHDARMRVMSVYVPNGEASAREAPPQARLDGTASPPPATRPRPRAPLSYGDFNRARAA